MLFFSHQSFICVSRYIELCWMLLHLSFFYLGWRNPKRNVFLWSRFFCICLCSVPKTKGSGLWTRGSPYYFLWPSYISECSSIFWTCGMMLQLCPFIPLYTIHQQHTLLYFVESLTVEMAHRRQVSYCVELSTVQSQCWLKIIFPLKPKSADYFLAYTICHTFYQTGKWREGPLSL